MTSSGQLQLRPSWTSRLVDRFLSLHKKAIKSDLIRSPSFILKLLWWMIMSTLHTEQFYCVSYTWRDKVNMATPRSKCTRVDFFHSNPPLLTFSCNLAKMLQRQTSSIPHPFTTKAQQSQWFESVSFRAVWSLKYHLIRYLFPGLIFVMDWNSKKTDDFNSHRFVSVCSR